MGAIPRSIIILPPLFPPPPPFRLVVTAAGFDERLLRAARALLRRCGMAHALGDFLAARCEDLLTAFPTTLEEDEELLQQLAGSSASSSGGDSTSHRLGLAVQYRAGKKRVLLAALRALPGTV